MERKIQTQKTGRYFVSADIDSQTKHVWFVMHGYGQLAQFFIRKFQQLPPEHVVVAPEGMHRFYLQGTDGRVGASWMTKEAREDDIQDYIRFLDGVFSDLDLSNKNIKTHVLGFSQGTATASRWVSYGDVRFDSLILWAGVLAPDLDFKISKEKLFGKKIVLAYGTRDQYRSEERIEEQRQIFNQHELPFQEIEFEGEHTIYPEPLLKVADILK